MSGNNYFEIIKNAKANGFTITLLYVYLESFELAVERVAFRVSKGGHFIPSEIIERRYFKGLQNLKKYLNLVNDWFLLDNSKSDYKIIARSFNGDIEITNFEQHNLIIGYE